MPPSPPYRNLRSATLARTPTSGTWGGSGRGGRDRRGHGRGGRGSGGSSGRGGRGSVRATAGPLLGVEMHCGAARALNFDSPPVRERIPQRRSNIGFFDALLAPPASLSPVPELPGRVSQLSISPIRRRKPQNGCSSETGVGEGTKRKSSPMGSLIHPPANPPSTKSKGEECREPPQKRKGRKKKRNAKNKKNAPIRRAGMSEQTIKRRRRRKVGLG